MELQNNKEKILPGILKGETYFCIGMSEPDSGSGSSCFKNKGRKKEKSILLMGLSYGHLVRKDVNT